MPCAKRITRFFLLLSLFEEGFDEEETAGAGISAAATCFRPPSLGNKAASANAHEGSLEAFVGATKSSLRPSGWRLIWYEGGKGG